MLDFAPEVTPNSRLSCQIKVTPELDGLTVRMPREPALGKRAMNIAVNALAKNARDAAYALPLDKLNVAQPILFQSDTMWPYFERLRTEEPVHFCAESEFGPYWSITKYNDIMAVDTNHQVFSSDLSLGGITIGGGQANVDPLPMFIAMDPPKHDIQRKIVTPVVSPANLQVLGPIIRERAGKILDSLPIGEPFDWVDKVSIELTTMTLATLFDFPFE